MVISAETRAQIDAEIAKYPKKRGALLPALHLVQKQTGWIASETARELAAIFEIHPIEVMEVVTFYNMFHDRHESDGKVAAGHVTTFTKTEGATLAPPGAPNQTGRRKGRSSGSGRGRSPSERCI